MEIRRHYKRSHKAWVVLMAVLAGFALVAAACGSDDDEAAPEPDATTTTQMATTTSAAPSGGGDDSGDGGSEGSSGGTDGDGAEAGTEGGGDGVTTSGDTTEMGGDSECDIPPYQDPRGGIFQDYQNQIDRCHPFQPLDDFCVPNDVPEIERVATDPGITADSITLVHLRTTLEDLAEMGFAVPVGDTTKMYETFAWYVNNICGGVNGRMIDLKLVEVAASAPDIDALRNAACIQGTEDVDGVILMNSSGFQGSANLCIVEDHETAFISTQSQTEEYVELSDGRLIMMSLTLEEALRLASSVLIAGGELEGKTIAAIAPDTPGQPEAVENGLVKPLQEAGYDVPVFDVIGCSGTVSCTVGISESVNNLIEEGVDTVFMNMNIVSNPQYIAEMTRQGIEKDDITFIGSDFNSMASDLVSSKVVQFGGAEAGELYDGTVMVVSSDPAAFLSENYSTEFREMCNRVFSENHQNVPGNENLDDPPYDPSIRDEASAYAMVGSVCQQMRIAMRAIYDAGPNPTRADIYDEFADLGAMDSSSMLPFSIRPDKTQAPDAYHRVMFTYPCAAGEELATDQGTCLVDVENDEWRLIPR